jgi:hypothetical protein
MHLLAKQARVSLRIIRRPRTRNEFWISWDSATTSAIRLGRRRECRQRGRPDLCPPQPRRIIPVTPDEGGRL